MKESQNIEWKESWRDEYIKWICGFTNAAGGTLVIGKNDKGVITGIGNAKKLLEDIPNKVRDILGIIVDVNLKTDKGKEFLEIMVEPHPHPVSYKGQYHYRSGSTKQELRGSALDAFLLKKYGLHWDGVPVPNLLPESLEEKAFALFAKKAVKSKRLGDAVLQENRKSLLGKLHLVEGSYLKRAAALLFYEDPEQYVTGAYVKIGFFKTDSDLVYQDEIHGNMFQQVDNTIETWKKSPETTPKTREKTREKILKLILEDTSISIEEMSNRIGITQKGIEWQIMRLKKDGILKRIGPAKGGYWKVIEKKP